jgi:hypothetical protein
MVCSIHWNAYLLEYEDNIEFISFYQDYCLKARYENCSQFVNYHAVIDGFGACINYSNRFEFLPHDF